MMKAERKILAKLPGKSAWRGRIGACQAANPGATAPVLPTGPPRAPRGDRRRQRIASAKVPADPRLPSRRPAGRSPERGPNLAGPRRGAGRGGRRSEARRSARARRSRRGARLSADGGERLAPLWAETIAKRDPQIGAGLVDPNTAGRRLTKTSAVAEARCRRGEPAPQARGRAGLRSIPVAVPGAAARSPSARTSACNLDHHRPASPSIAPEHHRAPGWPAGPRRRSGARRVADLCEAARPHLEDSDLAGRALKRFLERPAEFGRLRLALRPRSEGRSRRRARGRAGPARGAVLGHVADQQGSRCRAASRSPMIRAPPPRGPGATDPGRAGYCRRHRALHRVDHGRPRAAPPPASRSPPRASRRASTGHLERASRRAARRASLTCAADSSPGYRKSTRFPVRGQVWRAPSQSSCSCRSPVQPPIRTQRGRASSPPPEDGGRGSPTPVTRRPGPVSASPRAAPPALAATPAPAASATGRSRRYPRGAGLPARACSTRRASRGTARVPGERLLPATGAPESGLRLGHRSIVGSDPDGLSRARRARRKTIRPFANELSSFGATSPGVDFGLRLRGRGRDRKADEPP